VLLVGTGCATGGAPTPSATGLSEDDGVVLDYGEGGADGPDQALAAAVGCLQGAWAEDMGNLLAQWRSGSPAVDALPVTALTGQNSLEVSADAMVYGVDYTATMAGVGDSGMSGESVVSGAATLDYSVTSPTMITVGPVLRQSVSGTSRVLLDGAVVSETPIAWDGGIQGEAIWWCEGDALSLEPASSGWIHLFTRTG